MTETEKLNYLNEQGIDAALGMRYADDSLPFYEELIGIFLEEYEDKASKVWQLPINGRIVSTAVRYASILSIVGSSEMW